MSFFSFYLLIVLLFIESSNFFIFLLRKDSHSQRKKEKIPTLYRWGPKRIKTCQKSHTDKIFFLSKDRIIVEFEKWVSVRQGVINHVISLGLVSGGEPGDEYGNFILREPEMVDFVAHKKRSNFTEKR